MRVARASFSSRARSPREARRGPQTDEAALIQTVDLKTHRSCAGPFNAIEHAHNFAIRNRSGRSDEDCFLDAFTVGKVDSIAQFIAICVIHQALLKNFGKAEA